MVKPYFIWQSISSLDMGLWLSQYPDFVRPTERVSQVVIPGRAGILTLSEGLQVYEPITLTCRVQALRTANAEALQGWLSGRGLVIFGNQPARAYMAHIMEEVVFTRISNVLMEAQIQFSCEPFKRQYPAEADITLSAAGTVTNPGNVEAYPVITITGSGDITLTVNDGTFEITDADTSVTLDCSARLAISNDGKNVLERTSGDFPYLLPGANAISWTGSVTSIVITPNWRWR